MAEVSKSYNGHDLLYYLDDGFSFPKICLTQFAMCVIILLFDRGDQHDCTIEEFEGEKNAVALKSFYQYNWAYWLLIIHLL